MVFTPRNRRLRRFELRRSPVDRMWRVWERRFALALALIHKGQIDARDMVDGPVWVVTGVYPTKRDALDAQGALNPDYGGQAAPIRGRYAPERKDT